MPRGDVALLAATRALGGAHAILAAGGVSPAGGGSRA